jgi:hypothetical protein
MKYVEKMQTIGFSILQEHFFVSCCQDYRFSGYPEIKEKLMARINILVL